MTDTRTFLENVLVWPADINSPTDWINVHVNAKNEPKPGEPIKNNGKPWVVGWPFKTVDYVLNRINWVESTADLFNVWVCMSQQSECTERAGKKPKALRKAANATWLKAIWIDCDVKPGDPKHYHTLTEAFDALDAFRDKVGLPLPSMTVNSGGGLHVYWISDTPLTPDQWRPYADGLKALLLREGIKCDTGLTTDVVRILRVPGTLNHKYSPPRPVELLHFGQVYNFETDLSLLSRARPTVTATVAKPRAEPGVILPATEEWGGGIFNAPDPAFSMLNAAQDALQAGCEPTGPHLVDPCPIFAKSGCAFLREALRTGGRYYDNPQWNLSVLCTAFMENGNEIAHQISKGHPTYAAADTQALFDRKVADRADRGIGYPSCAAIAGAGSEHCKACPHFAKGKSPLNIRPAVTATVTRQESDFADPYEEFVGPPFPLEILTPTLRNFVDRLSEAMGADASALAMAALTSVSGAIDAETCIHLGGGWCERPILWTVIVGPSSSMKSPIINRAKQPLVCIDSERRKGWEQRYKLWLQAKETDKKAACTPQSPRCVINDATPEKVAELLSRAPCGSLMVQDELAGWIGNFERYNSGSSRAFYLQAWNGGSFTKDRVGKGKNDIDAEIFVENLALGILGGIQPDRLAKLGDLTADGLLQRFLPCLMPAPLLGDAYARVEDVETKYEKLIRSINAAGPVAFKLDDNALPVRDELMQYLHKLELVDGFPDALVSAIGKLKGYFGRLCVVLQVAENHELYRPDPVDTATFTPEDAALLQQSMGLVADNGLSAGTNWSELVTRKTAEHADKLIREFLLPHLLGFYDVVVNGGKERERLRDLANFVLSTDKDRLCPSHFTAGVRSLRGEPYNLLKEWIGRLSAMGWLIAEEDKPGVPTKAWRVAAGLREYFANRREQARVARAEAHRILKAGGSRGSRKSV